MNDLKSTHFPNRIPNEESLRNEWMQALRWNNWEPSQYTTVCSEHFTPDSYEPGLKIQRLKKNAVPSIFPTFPSYLQTQPTTSRRALKRLESEKAAHEPCTKKPKVEPYLSPSLIVEIDHSYCKPKAEVLEVLLEQEISKNELLKRKLHNAKQSKRKLQQNWKDLLEVVTQLKTRNLVGEKAFEVLKQAASQVPFELVQRLQKKVTQTIPHNEKYPEELKSFALTLHFYSPKAYRFVRKVFDLSLPHESVLRKWCMNVDGSPGFTEQSFKQLEAKVLDEKKKNKMVIVHVTADEMAIHKKVDFNSGSLIGCVDLGLGSSPDDTTPEATEALVFMAVGVNSAWKLPLAYFLISSLTGDEKASLMDTCVNKLRDINVHVTGLTVDALSSNLTMMGKLGVTVDWKAPDPTFFPSEHLDEPLNVVFDPCHMLKLSRNALADLKVLKNSKGKEIKWAFIELLHELQVEEGVHAANKLRKAHIEFHRQKMKVSLAAQVLSNSVADALKFCREELNLPKFAGSEATEEFIRIFNDAFDIMNSRNTFGKNLKAPMSISNEPQWMAVLQCTRDYILGLTLSDGVKLVESRRKAGFVGLIMNIKSLQNIFDVYVRTGPLKFLITYKLSQDHLELFFGSIRSRLGCNNNPTAKQFASSYKRLLVHGVMEGLQGNCFPQDDTQVICRDIINSSLESNQKDDIKKVRAHYDLVDHEWDHDYVTSLTKIMDLSDFQESVTEYIAGFVIRQVSKSLDCEVCCQAVLSQTNCYPLKLVNLKDKGGLVRASKDVIQVCTCAELCLQRIAKTCRGVAPFSKNLLSALTTTVLEMVHEKYP